MAIDESVLQSSFLKNSPIEYDGLKLHPIKMKDIVDFNLFKNCLTVRKNSTFPIKKIIKMSYLDFLFFAHNNYEFANEFKMPLLPFYYSFALELLKLVFVDQVVYANLQFGGFKINDVVIDGIKFDEIRRIILKQNGIDFDIDEFIHYDTEQKLNSAMENQSGDVDVGLEDYIDSLKIELRLSDTEINEMPIRKFWRYIKRIQMREEYLVLKQAEYSGMVTFKEHPKHWMISIEENNKYDNVITDVKSINKSING